MQSKHAEIWIIDTVKDVFISIVSSLNHKQFFLWLVCWIEFFFTKYLKSGRNPNKFWQKNLHCRDLGLWTCTRLHSFSISAALAFVTSPESLCGEDPACVYTVEAFGICIARQRAREQRERSKWKDSSGSEDWCVNCGVKWHIYQNIVGLYQNHTGCNDW